MGETPTPRTPTPSILQGLAPEVEAAINPSATTQVPMRPQSPVQIPMRPEDQQEAAQPAGPGFEQTPYEKAGGTLPMHPVDKMANSFMDFLTNTLSKNGAGPAAPQEDHAPGSFGSKLAGAASALGAGLGDMRTGGDPRQGHGWLGAVGATLNARNERITKEKQQKFENDERLKNDQINIAKANMEAVAHARNMQFQDKAVRDASAASSAQFMDAFRDNYEVRDNITQDKMMELMKDPQFAKTHTGRITGYEPMLDAAGEPKMDPKTGLPVEMPLYSTVNLAPGDLSKQVTVNATMAKRWKDAGVKDVPVGTKMGSTMVADMDSDAQKFGSSLHMLNQGKVLPLPNDVKDQMADALKSTEVATALAHHPGDPLGGLFDAQKNVEDHIAAGKQALAAAQQSGDPAKIQAAQADLDHAQTTSAHLSTTINQGFTEDERKAYVKEKDAEAKQNAKDSKDAAEVEHWQREDRINAYKAEHPNGVGTGGGANGDIPISEGMQQQIDQLRTANPTGAAILDHYDNTTKAALMSVAFGDGSVDFNHTFPARLTKGAPGLNAQQAIAAMKQINPNFSEQQYKSTQEAYKTATTGKNAQAIQQYNNFIQHSAGAVDALGSANRQGPRVWNMALNEMQNAGYGTDATRIQSALSGPRGEIALLLSGGYAPSTDEKKAFDVILSDASRPSQLSAALQEYAKLGTIRLDNINQNYKRVTGKNLPRIIDQATLDAAKHLGVDPLTYGALQNLDSDGTIFGPQTPVGANLPPLPKAPQGKISVQIPGAPVGYIDPQALPKFKQDHPNARIANE